MRTLRVAGIALLACACTGNMSLGDKRLRGTGGSTSTGDPDAATTTKGTVFNSEPNSEPYTPPNCDGLGASPSRFDGGLVQIGGTDPIDSINLDVGGYFASGNYHGYCFTFADNKTDGSTVVPPCGGNGAECFTKDSGLCVTAALGVASSSIWGAGIGCSLGEEQSSGNSPTAMSLVGSTSMSVEVYGCKAPSTLRLQLNVELPIYEADIDLLHSGYYCADVPLSAPDSKGARRGTVAFSDLVEDCWNAGGLSLDLATQTIRSIQLQVNADGSKRTDWDFCVSWLSID